ncbi:hypothetical protein EYC84_005717 [Monilinia fructicola]|uniref:Uncharacterized protein n=1 Tax=Monilinia fructicola TaxID=38448 RepID=A0A5M9JXE9_MONFR|nr:hypothetical protein EYC84_005717 [Monilinia fructicola]
MGDRLFNGSPEGGQNSWMMDVPMPTSQSAAAQAMQVQDQMAHMGQMIYSEHNHTENTFNNPQSQSPKNHQRIAMNPMTTEFSAEYGNGQKGHQTKSQGKIQREPQKGSIGHQKDWLLCAQELCLYSAKLHTVLSHHQVLAAKGSASFHPSACLIEVSHFPATTIFASFPCLEANDIETGLTSYILDTDNADLATKLEAYAKRMMPIFIDNEPSHFIRTALQTALDISIHQPDKENKEDLMCCALELWTIVHIFVDSEIRWEMSAKSTLPGEEAGQSKAILSTERAFALIHTQLNAAAETKAADMCKKLLNELERRLLHKNSKGSFHLFLIALITLNCVERSPLGCLSAGGGEDFKEQWPLEKQPQTFANQGDDLINVLQTILRMRDVPPKTFVRQDNGVLAVDDTSAQDVRDFFEQVQITFTDVHDKQVRYFFDPADSRSFELRYISRLLLPQVPT